MNVIGVCSVGVYIEGVSGCNGVVRVCGRGGGMQSRRTEERGKRKVRQGEAQGQAAESRKVRERKKKKE